MHTPVNTVCPRPRARTLGVPFDGTPGPLNAITDVKGVLVGHTTLISDAAAPVRTGVTAVIPAGLGSWSRVPAAWFSLNGNGEMTGTAWLDESGFLEGPLMLTNTNSVGVVRDAVTKWGVARFSSDQFFCLPVVAETWDGVLNDINGFHVRAEHAMAAIQNAHGGPVPEGNVGGGTGMIAYDFKGGIGTASRLVGVGGQQYTLGVLVQSNFGRRYQLCIGGIPMGSHFTDLMFRRLYDKDGSVIVVVATDAPLLPHQLKRLCRRVSMGLGRNGAIAMNTSGDLFIGFSTAVPRSGGQSGDAATTAPGLERWCAIPNEQMDGLFEATIQATDEAVINSMVAADTMTGLNGTTVHALPHQRMQQALRQHHRLVGG